MLIEDSKFEIAKGPSKDLPTLPSSLSIYRLRYIQVENKPFGDIQILLGLKRNLVTIGHMLIMFGYINQTSPMTQKNVQWSYWYCRLDSTHKSNHLD